MWTALLLVAAGLGADGARLSARPNDARDNLNAVEELHRCGVAGFALKWALDGY